MSDWAVVWENQAQDVGEALMETNDVKDLISSHKTLRILMDTQLTIQGNTTRCKAIQGNTTIRDKCVLSTNCLSTHISNRLVTLAYTLTLMWTSFKISFLISMEFDPYFQSTDEGTWCLPTALPLVGRPLLRRLRFGTPATLPPFCVWTGPADFKYEWDQLGGSMEEAWHKASPPSIELLSF